MDSRDVEDLWGFLKRYEATTGGGQAIPTTVIEQVRMFPALGSEKMSESYARQSARWEPLEVTQVKRCRDPSAALS